MYRAYSALLGYDKKLCAEVTGAFVEEQLRSLKRRAKRLFKLASVDEAAANLSASAVTSPDLLWPKTA